MKTAKLTREIDDNVLQEGKTLTQKERNKEAK